MDTWRQWIRHRMASVNEYSTRYSVVIDAPQRTKEDGWRLQSGENRQGSSGFLEHGVGANLSIAEEKLRQHARQVHEERLAAGVAREQARKDLPLSTYTEAYWKVDLHNLLNECQDRTHAFSVEPGLRRSHRKIGNTFVRALRQPSVHQWDSQTIKHTARVWCPR
jgi:thymidylate synthase (FAD)